MEQLPESFDRNTSIVLLCQLSEKINNIKSNLLVIKNARNYNESFKNFQDKIEILRKKEERQMKEVKTLFDAFQKSFNSNGLDLALFQNFNFTGLFQENTQEKIKTGLDNIKNLPENSKDREALLQQFEDQFEKSEAAIQAALKIHESFGTRKRSRQTKNDPFLIFISQQKTLVQEEKIKKEIQIIHEAREDYMNGKETINKLKNENETNTKIIQLYQLDQKTVQDEIQDSNFTEIDKLFVYNKSIYYDLKYKYIDVFSKFSTNLKQDKKKVAQQDIQKRINFISNIVIMAKIFQAFYDTNFAKET